MPRKKQPVSVLRANGSRHYTKQELEQREAAEVKAPEPTAVEPPKYLTGDLVRKFRELAPTLMQMGVLTELDADGLARYLIAERNYLRATNQVTAALNTGNTAEAAQWSAIQDRFFRQCRAAGADFGLSVSARCALVVPQPEATGAREDGDLFGDGD